VFKYAKYSHVKCALGKGDEKVIRLQNAWGPLHATFDLKFTPDAPESESRLCSTPSRSSAAANKFSLFVLSALELQVPEVTPRSSL
jgi:hypothetical protein